MPTGARILAVLAACGGLLGGVLLLVRRRVAEHRRRAEAAEARAQSYLKLLEGVSEIAKSGASEPLRAAPSSSGIPAPRGERAAGPPTDSRYLFVSFDEEILRARRRSASLTLVTLSLDNAREADNEDYDRLLRAVALAVRGQLRGCDTCVRYAADEFILILPGVAREEARRVEGRLRVAIQSLRPETRGAAARLPRARLGSATFPTDGSSFDQILTLAETRRAQDGAPRRDLPPATSPSAFRVPPLDLSRN